MASTMTQDAHETREWTEGERGFSHYVMAWGTVVRKNEADLGWFTVEMDDGTTEFLNAVRFVTPAVAQRFGYGVDPKTGIDRR